MGFDTVASLTLLHPHVVTTKHNRNRFVPNTRPRSSCIGQRHKSVSSKQQQQCSANACFFAYSVYLGNPLASIIRIYYLSALLVSLFFSFFNLKRRLFSKLFFIKLGISVHCIQGQLVFSFASCLTLSLSLSLSRFRIQVSVVSTRASVISSRLSLQAHLTNIQPSSFITHTEQAKSKRK